MGQVSYTARGPLKGELRLGAIPASMPATGYLVEAVRARFPELNVKLRALTSRLIERELYFIGWHWGSRTKKTWSITSRGGVTIRSPR